MKHAILTLIGAWLIGTVGLSQTPVSGTIVNQTWTLTGSPYEVVDNIFVSILTIEPGVEVIFQGAYLFEVGGVLTAIGTACDSIYFLKADTAQHWQGIYFNSSNPGSELSFCHIEGSSNSGLHLKESLPNIHNCTITGNTATHGGGVYIESGACVLVECRIANNSVDLMMDLGINATYSGYGGGVYATGSVTLIGCILEQNTLTVNHSGGLGHHAVATGGGICALGSSALLQNCILRNNICEAIAPFSFGSSATSKGGGAYLAGQYQIVNSIILGNQCISTTAPSLTMQGGGIYSSPAINSKVVNCSIAYNVSNGLDHIGGASLLVSNSVLFFNTPQSNQAVGSVGITYCDVEDGASGTGNIDVNPIFQSQTDLTIVPGSLCIDAGDPASVNEDLCSPPSLGGPRNDMGAHGGPGACFWPCTQTCPDSSDLDVVPLPQGTAIDLGISGGTPPYAVLWLGPNGFLSTDQNISGLTVGWYSYAVRSSGIDCAESVGAVYIDQSVGISEQANQLSVWPNPFADAITVQSPVLCERIQIKNAMGEVIRDLDNTPAKSLTWDGRTTSGTEVPPGMYLVTVIADGQRYTQRVVKQ